MQAETQADKATLTPLHRKRSEKTSIGQYHSAFKVLRVGGQHSPSLEKEWRNKAMCIFSQSEQRH